MHSISMSNYWIVSWGCFCFFTMSPLSITMMCVYGLCMPRGLLPAWIFTHAQWMFLRSRMGKVRLWRQSACVQILALLLTSLVTLGKLRTALCLSFLDSIFFNSLDPYIDSLFQNTHVTKLAWAAHETLVESAAGKLGPGPLTYFNRGCSFEWVYYSCLTLKCNVL